MLFTLSYALLAAMVVFEAMALQWLLARVVSLRKLYQKPVSSSGRQMLLSGDPAPDFEVRVLGTDETLTASHLKGHETILAFVAADQASLPTYRNLGTALHAMWHIMEGHLYVVCQGAEKACRQLADEIRVDQRLMLWDESGEVAQRFLIDETPVAWRLDEDLRLIRYGRAVSLEEWEGSRASVSKPVEDEKS